MIYLKPLQLRSGLVTAQSVLNDDGSIMIARGAVLLERHVERLRQLRVPGLVVTSLSPTWAPPPPFEMVAENLRADAVKSVAEVFHQLVETGQLDLALLQFTADLLLASIQKDFYLVQETELRMPNAYLYAHSVNVAILSGMLGLLCGYPQDSLRVLMLGGLLHDMGTLSVPKNILNKPVALTNEEFALIRRHTSLGTLPLQSLPANVMELVTLIVNQHHEHMDGRGYPRGLRGEQIHPFGRIVAIADVYDALSSTRPYKKPYRPHVVHRLMTHASKGHFDPVLLEQFFRNIAVYPVGTTLKTRFGFAIVRQVTFGRTMTPIITVFADKEGRVLPNPFHVDLSQCPPQMIHCVMEDAELMIFVHHTGFDPVQCLKEPITSVSA